MKVLIKSYKKQFNENFCINWCSGHCKVRTIFCGADSPICTANCPPVNC